MSIIHRRIKVSSNFTWQYKIILINLIKPANVFALSTTIAKEEINNDTNCNVTLSYYYDDYNFDNTNIKIYHIASIT